MGPLYFLKNEHPYQGDCIIWYEMDIRYIFSQGVGDEIFVRSCFINEMASHLRRNVRASAPGALHALCS